MTTQKIRVLTNASISNDGYSRITEVEAYQSTQSTATTTGSVQWLVTDHLGTPRLIADLTGSLSGITRHDYLPFGEELKAGTGVRTGPQGYSQPDGHRKKWATYERDEETGVDYAQARYYGSMKGCFTSPDPTLLSVNGHNPQTWNRYTYVLNNPLAFVDPLGLWALKFENAYKMNKDGSYKLDKKGSRIVDRVEVTAVKTKDGDDGASLAKQLGLSGKEADAFASKIGNSDNIKLSKQGGDVGRIFSVVEDLLGSQERHTSQGKSGGPADITYADCSSTSSALAFPQDGINGTNSSVFAADGLITSKGLKSVSADALSIGDIVRYATGKGNTPAHFTTFIFRDDDGDPQVFSRSGAGGPFQHGSAYSFQNSTYGTIRGIGKDPTGFYSRGK